MLNPGPAPCPLTPQAVQLWEEPPGLWYFATAAGAKTKSNLGSFACVCVCVCVCRFWAAGGLASLSGLLFLPRRTLIKSNAFPSLHEELDLRDN